MAVGVRWIGADTGVIQVDSSYFNLAFISKATVTPTTPYSFAKYGRSYYIDLQFSGVTNPTLAIHCANAGGAQIVHTQYPSAGVVIFRVVCRLPQPFEYFLYDIANTDPHGIGIRIKNPATGLTVYNSLLNYQKVLEFYSGQDQLGSGASLRIVNTYPGKKVAVVQGTRRILVQDSVFSDFEAYTTFYTTWMIINGAGAAIDLIFEMDWMDGPWDPSRQPVQNDFDQGAYGFLIVDVTDL